MARRKINDRNIRTLIKGTSSYMVTLPIELVRELKWREGQNLEIKLDKKELVIRDWKE